MGSYQTVTIGGKTVFKYTNPEGRTVFSDIPPTPDQILQESGGESSDDSAVCDNRCMGRIQTLQDTYHVTRAQAEEMYRREQDTKAQQERRLKDVEEAREQGRLRALLEEEAELAKAEEALSVTSIAKDVFLPQSKLDWVLLLGGAIGKVGKGSNAVYKVLSREKALEKLRKRRNAIKEALEAKKAKKAEEGLHIEKQVGNRLVIDKKIESQLKDRGWTKQELQEAVNKKPVGSTMDKRTAAKTTDGLPRNDTASVYGSKNGYVVVNDRTKEVVQISGKNDPGWIPDSRIQWKE